MPGHELDDVINQRLNLYDVLELPTPLDARTISGGISILHHA